MFQVIHSRSTSAIHKTLRQNKEAEAKEELKRRAKQLEMQRREQQRRAASTGGGSNFSGSGMGAYSPVPRFEAPSPSPVTQRTSSPAPSSLKAPAFKGSGMKLGSSKKARNAELLDVLGGEAVITDDLPTPGISAPGTPAAMSSPEPHGTANGARGSIPAVTAEGYVVKSYLEPFANAE